MSDNKFDKIYGMLLYVSLQEPVKAYVKTSTPPKPDEWKASVVLTDEDFVDELEEYAASLGTQISLKKVKTSEFKEVYKVDPPENAGNKVWVFTLRKSTELGKTGKPVPEMYRPKVFEKQGARIVDITKSKLVGNGSMGAISIDKFERNAGGASLFLKNVLVTDLIEYVRTEGEGYQSGSEFEEEGSGEPAPKAEEKPAKATKGKAKPAPASTEEEDDSPF